MVAMAVKMYSYYGVKTEGRGNGELKESPATKSSKKSDEEKDEEVGLLSKGGE